MGKQEASYWVECAKTELEHVSKLLKQNLPSSALSKLADLTSQLQRASKALKQDIQGV